MQTAPIRSGSTTGTKHSPFAIHSPQCGRLLIYTFLGFLGQTLQSPKHHWNQFWPMTIAPFSGSVQGTPFAILVTILAMAFKFEMASQWTTGKLGGVPLNQLVGAPTLGGVSVLGSAKSSAHLQRHCRRRSSAPRFWFEARVDVSGGGAIVLPSRSCSSLAVCKLFSRIESVNSIYFYNYSTAWCLCLFAGLYSYHGRERASLDQQRRRQLSCYGARPLLLGTGQVGAKYASLGSIEGRMQKGRRRVLAPAAN